MLLMPHNHQSFLLYVVVAFALLTPIANLAADSTQPHPPTPSPFMERGPSSEVARLVSSVSNQSSLTANTVRPPTLKPNSKGQFRYIIRLKDAPLALYQGGLTGLAATNPTAADRTKRTKLDLKSAVSQTYHSYLQQQNMATRSTIERNLNRSVVPLHSYNVALYGFAAELTPDEAQQVANLAGVVQVAPDRQFMLATNCSPRLINSHKIWSGLASGLATQGEGIVIGVLDTGITPTHRSFAGVGDDDYHHVNPRGRFFGVCDATNAHYDPTFPCNDKLIGAYNFASPTAEEPYSALDNAGHGTHVASIAAGNVATFDSEYVGKVRISGVAPHANLISYRVINSKQAIVSDMIAGFEQAILDDVDIINFSVYVYPIVDTPWAGPLDLALLATHSAGIVVVNAAGNEGAMSDTIGEPGTNPWVLTVGAATTDNDCEMGGQLTDLTRNDATVLPDIFSLYQEKTAYLAYGPARIVYAGSVPKRHCGISRQCRQRCPAGTFHNEIVVCDTSKGISPKVQSRNLRDSGAGGIILANDETAGEIPLALDDILLPVINIGYTDGQVLKTWLATDSGHSGLFFGGKTVLDRAKGNEVAFFSARGPNLVPDLLKPDLIAPGDSILAAFDDDWYLIHQSGTSMAAPHVAGAAALLKVLHPDWSPDAIKSALMTTALTQNLTAYYEAGVFDYGAGRISLGNAARANLVLEENVEAYLAADPAKGGDPSALNLPSLAKANCTGSCRWQRTVRNPGTSTVSWSVRTSMEEGVKLRVSPNAFTLAPGASQTLTIKALVIDQPSGNWKQGQVILTPNSRQFATARLPVVVRPTE